MKLQFSIKELSKIVDLPAGTIRYYCKIGLLKPSGVLENGYRYFHIEKIEELRLITYMRHLGVSLNDIEQHLKNRNIAEFEKTLRNQLSVTRDKIKHLSLLEIRLENRLKRLEYFKNLPELNTIQIERLPKRKILKLSIETHDQHDIEKALMKLESLGELPPSAVIGDHGYFVDLKKWKSRKPEDFIGLYMLADDPFVSNDELLDELPEGEWLTVYLEGNHDDALESYGELIKFASDNSLVFGNYAIERILVDQFISNDPSSYIIEIQIPISSCNICNAR